MLGIYNISATEREIMNLLWERGQMTSREILEYFNDVFNKNWKKQTLNTFLSRLIDKGLLTITPTERKKVYSPAMSKEQYEQCRAKSIIDVIYDGSLSKFFVALNGGENISAEEAELLRKILDE